MFDKKLLILVILSCLLMPEMGTAQHPIEVQRKAAQGDYFEALRLFEKMPRRIATTESLIAAGKSAWALGLPGKAIEEFDQALRDQNLAETERARLLLARAIIEHQEGRYRVGILYAEKAIAILKDPSPLRANAWLLWGECLSRLKSYGAAEHKYAKALQETDGRNKAELHYLLGAAQVKLGNLQEARGNFEKVPLHHERTPEAIRYLASIAIDENKFEEAAFWLDRGRKDYPDYFLDSWVDYALLQVAADAGNTKKVRAIQAKAQQKYPPSDQWLTLLNAAAEAYEWNFKFETAVKK